MARKKEKHVKVMNKVITGLLQVFRKNITGFAMKLQVFRAQITGFRFPGLALLQLFSRWTQNCLQSITWDQGCITAVISLIFGAILMLLKKCQLCHDFSKLCLI